MAQLVSSGCDAPVAITSRSCSHVRTLELLSVVMSLGF